MLFKALMILSGATLTSWFYFIHASIDELNFWAFTVKGGGHVLLRRLYWDRNIYEEQPEW